MIFSCKCGSFWRRAVSHKHLLGQLHRTAHVHILAKLCVFIATAVTDCDPRVALAVRHSRHYLKTTPFRVARWGDTL